MTNIIHLKFLRPALIAFSAFILLGSAWLIAVLPPEKTFLGYGAMGLFVLALIAMVLKMQTPVVRTTVEEVQPPSPVKTPSQFTDRFQRFFPSLEWRRWRQLLILLFGLALIYWGQFRIYRNPSDRPISSDVVFALTGLGIFLAMLNGTTLLVESDKMAVPENVQPLRFNLRWFALSVALFGVVAWRSILKPQEAFLTEHLLLWGIGMVTLVKAVTPKPDQARVVDANPLRKWEYGLLIVLAVSAFLVRWVNINKEPYLLDNDEALFAVEGADLWLDNYMFTPFEPGVHSHPRMYQGMIAVSVGIFGPTLQGARLPSILLGALTIPMVYLLGREMRGRRAGLIAALFMVGWSYQVQFSRLSMNQPADPLFGAMAFYFLLRGLRRGTVIDYVLCGIAVGVAQMFYLGGRLIPLVMIAYLFFLWLRRHDLIQKQWRMLLLIPLTAFLVTLPQNFYLFYFHEPFSTRADPSIFVGGQFQEVMKSGQTASYFFTQFKDSFMALFMTSDRSIWYGPSSNLMGPFGGPLLLLGAIMSLFILWKRPLASLPLGWAFAVIVSGSTLAISPPQYERYFPGTVAYAFLVEIGIATVALGVSKILERPRLLDKVALAIGGVVCLANLAFYVGVYIPEGKYLNNRTNWRDNRISAEMLADYAAGDQVVLIGGFDMQVQDTLVIQYFMSGKKYIYDENKDDIGLSKVDTSKPFVLIVAPERKADLDAAMQKVPGGKLTEVHLDQDDSLVYYRYEKNSQST